MALKNSALLAICATILMAPGAATAGTVTVVAGSDYLITTVGFADIQGFGPVNFAGNPDLGYGPTDTIVERTSNITLIKPGDPLNTTPNLLVTALSLKSTAPVTYMGQTFFLYATVDPTPPPPSANSIYPGSPYNTGIMNITGTAAGGTFMTSDFSVFFDICQQPGAGGVGCKNGAAPLATGAIDLSRRPLELDADRLCSQRTAG